MSNDNNTVVRLQNEESWKDYMEMYLPSLELHFSDNPERI